MAEGPILFSAPMVRAILREIEYPGAGKTQTRRIWTLPKDHRWKDEAGGVVIYGGNGMEYGVEELRCRYAPGDRLWVRETWTARMTHGWTIADARSRMYQEEILYRADVSESIDGWWPSIHMPREFSRITLIVTDVRVQRLQEISEADAIAEGISPDPVSGRYFCSMDEVGPVTAKSAITAFGWLWNGINGKRPGCHWQDNPWVAAYTFRPILGNIDQVAA